MALVEQSCTHEPWQILWILLAGNRKYASTSCNVSLIIHSRPHLMTSWLDTSQNNQVLHTIMKSQIITNESVNMHVGVKTETNGKDLPWGGLWLFVTWRTPSTYKQSWFVQFETHFSEFETFRGNTLMCHTEGTCCHQSRYWKKILVSILAW